LAGVATTIGFGSFVAVKPAGYTAAAYGSIWSCLLELAGIFAAWMTPGGVWVC